MRLSSRRSDELHSTLHSLPSPPPPRQPDSFAKQLCLLTCQSVYRQPVRRSIRLSHAASALRTPAALQPRPRLCPTLLRHRTTAPCAIAEPPPATEESLPDVDGIAMEHSKVFKYDQGRFELKITVRELENGSQRVHLRTRHPSDALILHWGVQGGRNYRGGWRLPEQRPPGTEQYKERALQTQWQCALILSCLLSPHDGAHRMAQH